MWPLSLSVNAFITIQLVFSPPPHLICSFFQYPPLPLPPPDLHQPPRLLPSSLTLSFSPSPPAPNLCFSSSSRLSISSPHIIHSCLWHSHISPSIHLLSLSRSPPFFPPFLRWWSRLVLSVRPSPLLWGYGFNLGGRRCAHQHTGVPSQWPWERRWIYTCTVILENWELSAEMQIFCTVLLCCSLLLSPCVWHWPTLSESHTRWYMAMYISWIPSIEIEVSPLELPLWRFSHVAAAACDSALLLQVRMYSKTNQSRRIISGQYPKSMSEILCCKWVETNRLPAGSQ